MREQLRRIRPLYDAPVSHDHHIVGEVGDHTHVVCDQQHGGSEAVAEFADEVQDARLHRDVECSGRLVGDECHRITRDRHGDHRALQLTAGEFVRVRPGDAGRVRDPDRGQQTPDAVARLRATAIQAVRGQCFRDLAADRDDRVERGHRLLEHRADAAAAHLAQPLRAGAEQFFAQQPHASGDRRARRQESERRHGRHALARAGFADERKDTTGREIETHPVDDGSAAHSFAIVPVGERDRDLVHRQDRRVTHRWELTCRASPSCSPGRPGTTG